jgi:hypothetical protein
VSYIHTYKQYYLLCLTPYSLHHPPPREKEFVLELKIKDTYFKEERCYLPDGIIYELRDIWTADSTTEE